MVKTERKKIVAFGELLLRLAPRGFERLVQADFFEARYTGAEANAAVSLVNFGMEAFVVSKVPGNEIGQACLDYLARYRVNVDHVARGGERLGLFYLETGAAQRPSKVIYDRSDSAICHSEAKDYDWDAICAGKDWFHFSGTLPALGAKARSRLGEALSAAKAAGLTVSCDLNYRAKLWSPKEAQSVMPGIMEKVDVLIGNEEDAEKVFGMKAESSDTSKGLLPEESYSELARRLAARFGFKFVATTLRESISASANGWSGILFDGKKAYTSRKYRIEPIVDRVGGGDSFSGGLIFSMLSAKTPQETIEFAVAASCLKHSIPGDFNHCSLAEVEALVAGDAAGRIRR
jgi:2-dehydro-3-deoxygluconokinase